jgi:UDP-glucuronate 4-epimerase
MSKVLVTGGAGFIGSQVSVKLLARGDEVVIIDDFNDRYNPKIKEARMDNLFKDVPKPTLVREDLCDLKVVTKLFSKHKFDQVIHLAAWAAVQGSLDDPYIYTKTNVDGTVNIFNTAKDFDIKNIVFASSSSVYGGREKVPFKETDDISSPISPYAATKAAGELMCATWYNLYKIPITALRFFTVYGPWGRPEMAMFLFAKAILEKKPIQMRGKDTMRDFTYIEDCVDGVIAALDHPHDYTILNIGESDVVPLPRLISLLEEELGKKAIVEEVPLPLGDVPRTLADISKAKELIGYSPTTKIEDGVKKFTEWYLDWYIPKFEPKLNKTISR